jgi:dihydroxy-acid dehydratase
MISIDLEARRIDVELSAEEIAARVAAAVPPDRRLTSRWLRRYRALVTSANTGAILREPD